MCVYTRAREIYTGNIMTIGLLVMTIFEVLMSAFVVGLVKRGVFTLVGEIWRFRNDRY